MLQSNGDAGSKSVVTVPITEAQMELWLATQLGDDASRSFNQVFMVRLRGSLQLAELGRAVQAVVDRHDALRTTFLPDGSGQRISPTLKIELSRQDISALSNADQEEQLAEMAKRRMKPNLTWLTGH